MLQSRRIRFPWSEVTTSSLLDLGGEASLQDLYAKARELYPKIETSPLWQIRIRGGVEEIAINVGRGRWKIAGASKPSNPEMGE